jgi:spermidine synthase
MAQPWTILDRADTPDGVLELRRRGDRDFLITINGRVLMNSSASRSEAVLGRHAGELVAGRPSPRVLFGGLGMGLTLRAALDVLPSQATVTVAELNPAVVAWCRGPLAELNQHAVADERTAVEIADVNRVITKAAAVGAVKYDAIVIDLYEGPHAGTDSRNDPFYGSRALDATSSALAPAGVFAVWGESPDRGFERRLATAGFTVQWQRPGRGGLRHVVYTAQKGGRWNANS